MTKEHTINEEYSFKQHLHLGHVHSHLQAQPVGCRLPETLPSLPSANTQSSHLSPHTLEIFFPLSTILFSLEFIQQHLLTPTTCQALFQALHTKTAVPFPSLRMNLDNNQTTFWLCDYGKHLIFLRFSLWKKPSTSFLGSCGSHGLPSRYCTVLAPLSAFFLVSLDVAKQPILLPFFSIFSSWQSWSLWHGKA